MTPPPSLDELIQTVRRDSSSDDQLDQLATAASTVHQLGEVGDALLGHYVDQCRRSGRTWTEISSVLGVTKQAVHKRFSLPASGTLERFTDRARHTVSAATDAARELGHNFVGTEHVLIGQFSEPKGIAGRILADLGITRDAVVAATVAQRPPGTFTMINPPYTPQAASVLQSSVAETLQLGHNYVGTEHLLLALVNNEGMAKDILTSMNAQPDAIRTRVLKLLEAFKAK